MEKVDFKRTFKELYTPPKGKFVRVDVPTMNFIKVDGKGDPNISDDYKTALEWLYSTSYGMKFAAKTGLGRDYVVPPLEGLWWAEDPAAFVAREKHKWHWTMMIMVPDFVTNTIFGAAVEKAGKKLGIQPDSLRLEAYEEGHSLQTLHLGSYDDEAPILKELHESVMPGMRVTFNGPHHEIYLSDPRKVEPSKNRTILRQPVKAK